MPSSPNWTLERQVTSLDQVNIHTDDLPASVRLYAELLGLERGTCRWASRSGQSGEIAIRPCAKRRGRAVHSPAGSGQDASADSRKGGGGAGGGVDETESGIGMSSFRP